MDKQMYRLETWDKNSHKYVVHYEGHDLNRAEIQAHKRYNNRDWHGKHRILSISNQLIKTIPARKRLW